MDREGKDEESQKEKRIEREEDEIEVVEGGEEETEEAEDDILLPSSSLTQSDTDLLNLHKKRNGKKHRLTAESTPTLEKKTVDEYLDDIQEESDCDDEGAAPVGGARLSSEMEINLQHLHNKKKYQEIRGREERKRRLTGIDFEGVLNLIGGCNKWQMLCYCLISIQQIPHAMFNLSVVYMMYQPDHWCKVTGFSQADVRGRDYSFSQLLNSTLLFLQTPNRQRKMEKWHDQCSYIKRDYSSLVNYSWTQLHTIIRSNETVQVERCTEWEYDKSVMTHTVVTQWDRVCDDNWSRAHVHLSYSLGFLAGCIMSGILSDRYGRRRAMIIFGVAAIILAAILPNVRDFPVFLFIRFFLAAANEAADLTAYVLCMEITGVKYRSMVGCLMHAPWALGYALLALIAYGWQSWTWIHYFSLFLHFIAMLALFAFLPESPRWLIIQGKIDEAEQIIRKACALNKSNLPSDLGIICHAENKKWKKEHKDTMSSRYLALFKSAELRRQNIIIVIIWTSTALVYYGLVIALSDQSSPGRSIFAGNFFLNNAMAGAIELPTLFCCVVLLKIGRKRSQMITLIGAGICLLFALCGVWYEYSTLSLIFMLLGKSFIQGAFNILYIFTSEMSPTVVRNSAVGFASMIARMGSGASGYLAILSDVTFPFVPMIIFTTFSFIAGSLVVFLPETQDEPLPDTIWDAHLLNTTQKEKQLMKQGLQPFREEDEEEEQEIDK